MRRTFGLWIFLFFLTWSLVGFADVGTLTEVGTPDHGELKTDLGVSSRYVYNVYYDALRAISDGLMAVQPEISGHTKPSKFYLDADLKGLYEQYFTQTIQNHFDYQAASNIYINEDAPKSFILSGKYRSFSDPSPNETYGRLTRNQIDGAIKFKSKSSVGDSFDMTFHFFSEDFINPTLNSQSAVINPDYLANQTFEGIAQYGKAFLPETSWIIRGTGGATQYPNSAFTSSIPGTSLDPSLQKQNSYYGLLEGGVVGRLAEKSTIDFATGYLYRAYADGYGFSGPVFYVHFTEQVTRRDQLLAGYNYVVKDSYWTDYYLDQEIYLGLARVVGDQLIVLSRMAYEYKSFSLPTRRDDEHVTASLVAKYSLSKAIKITADVKVDLLSSDAFNTATPTSPATNPNGSPLIFLDAPASYKAGSFGLGLIAEF